MYMGGNCRPMPLTGRMRLGNGHIASLALINIRVKNTQNLLPLLLT